MKTALDFARQALRFAERALVEPDATAIRLDWLGAYEAGQRAAKRQARIPRTMRRNAWADARWNTKCSAQHARDARATRYAVWFRKDQARAARLSAMNAARCAGYAAGV